MITFEKISILFLVSLFGIITSQYIGPLVFDFFVGQLVMPVIFTLICAFIAIYSVTTIKYVGGIKEATLRKIGAKKVILILLGGGLFYYLYPTWTIIIYFATILFFEFAKTWYINVIEETSFNRSENRDRLAEVLCLGSAASFIYHFLWVGIFWQIYIYNPGNWDLSQTGVIVSVLLSISFLLFFREFIRGLGLDQMYISKHVVKYERPKRQEINL